MRVNNLLRKRGNRMPVSEMTIAEAEKYAKALEILKTEVPDLKIQYQFFFCENAANPFRAICEKLEK